MYRATHDPDGPARLSTTVAHALADCLRTDVTTCHVALSDAVDLEALDRLFRPRGDGRQRVGGSLTVTVRDHRVTVDGNGDVLIEPIARR
ncbi:hypothetical protein C493_14063 [Natronolimnohabitans innermongolicus JCM 12255]|uniref:Halobacterial output domain-containing protein n=1 Tax=Natronolimnohabitans innermongolicus JCM 12255 TaxID=1227499 RepID=L9WW38_9EURY|nr:hypothetical protein C493_14063 [Natronolimnohabitans innermongolicus JCM 12255]